jgi:hypothetical protein
VQLAVIQELREQEELVEHQSLALLLVLPVAVQY